MWLCAQDVTSLPVIARATAETAGCVSACGTRSHRRRVWWGGRAPAQRGGGVRWGQVAAAAALKTTGPLCADPRGHLLHRAAPCPSAGATACAPGTGLGNSPRARVSDAGACVTPLWHSFRHTDFSLTKPPKRKRSQWGLEWKRSPEGPHRAGAGVARACDAGPPRARMRSPTARGLLPARASIAFSVRLIPKGFLFL